MYRNNIIEQMSKMLSKLNGFQIVMKKILTSSPEPDISAMADTPGVPGCPGGPGGPGGPRIDSPGGPWSEKNNLWPLKFLRKLFLVHTKSNLVLDTCADSV
jgi:hypothetical protein